MTFALREYQREAIDLTQRRIAEGHRPIICAPTGCHQRGTLILRPDGKLVRVEELKVGDRVMGPDSKPRTVTCLHRGFDEMFRIVPTKGDPFVVNGGHVLSLKTTNVGTSATGRIENITVRDWLARSTYYKHTRKLYRVGVEFEQQAGDMPLSPYFLGTLLGDGHLKYGAVSVCTADIEVMLAAEREASLHGLSLRREAAGGRSYSYHIQGGRRGGKRNAILQAIRYLQLEGRRSGYKFIPPQYLTAPRDDRLELLAGLIDTDGCNAGGCFDYVTKSRGLARDVVFLARSVGLAAYMKPCTKRCGDFSGGYFRISISGDCAMVPCRIPRKRCMPRRQKKDALVTGFSVEPVGVGPYYGFECDGDHLYVMADFTVTHNSGKTVISGAMAKDYIDQGKRVLFLSGRREILRQSYDTFVELCGKTKVGFLMAGEGPYWFYPPVTVASWDTLKARWEKSETWRVPADVVMYDEAHLALSAKMLRTIIPHYECAVNIGLTATPAKQSGKGLGSHFTRIIQVRSVQQIIDEGFLAACEYWGGSHADVSKLHTRNGDFVQKELAAAHRDNVLVGDVVDNWLRLAADRHTIVFAVDIQHAEALTQKFQAAGINAETLHSKMTTETRTRISDSFRAREVQVLVNVGIATYGYDVPSVNCVVLARPTKSIVLHLQMIGRGMRPKPDGDYCMVLDHAGNVDRLGCAEDEMRWTLDEGREAATNWRRLQDERKGTDQARLTQCGNCYHLFGQSRVCPKCGWEKPVAARDIHVVDGELVRRRKAKADREEREGWPSDEMFYRMLRGYAMTHRYKPGWVYFKFRERCGYQPTKSWNDGPACEPNPRVAAWIKSQQIRFAKRRRA